MEEFSRSLNGWKKTGQEEGLCPKGSKLTYLHVYDVSAVYWFTVLLYLIMWNMYEWMKLCFYFCYGHKYVAWNIEHAEFS